MRAYTNLVTYNSIRQTQRQKTWNSQCTLIHVTILYIRYTNAYTLYWPFSHTQATPVYTQPIWYWYNLVAQLEVYPRIRRKVSCSLNVCFCDITLQIVLHRTEPTQLKVPISIPTSKYTIDITCTEGECKVRCLSATESTKNWSLPGSPSNAVLCISPCLVSWYPWLSLKTHWRKKKISFVDFKALLKSLIDLVGNTEKTVR